MVKPEFIIGAEAFSGDKLSRPRKWRKGYITVNGDVAVCVLLNIYTDDACEQNFAVFDELDYNEVAGVIPVTFTYDKDATDFKEVFTHVMNTIDNYYSKKKYYDNYITERSLLWYEAFKFMNCLINPDTVVDEDIKITNYANFPILICEKDRTRKPELRLKVIDQENHLYGLISEESTEPTMTFKVIHDPENKRCCIRTFSDILYNAWGSFFNLNNPKSNPGVVEMLKFVFEELIKHEYPKYAYECIRLDELNKLHELAYECVHEMINEV